MRLCPLARGTILLVAHQGGEHGHEAQSESGGPAFLGQYVVGDSSFVNSLSCNATAGYQRVDTPYARAFLEQFL